MAGAHAEETDLVNLLLFTVELEGSDPSGRKVRGRPHPSSARGASRFRWIVLTIAAIVCSTAAGWVLSGGGRLAAIDVPEWLRISTAWAAADPATIAEFHVTSQPVNATVLVDGRDQGRTPLSLKVVKGMHALRLIHATAIDDERQVSVSGNTYVNVSMMWRRPEAMLLKPAYPGANISRATFLADGRVAMTMAAPSPNGNGNSRRLNEAWILNPATGRLDPASSVRAAIIAVSPDGNSVAFAEPHHSKTGDGSPRLTDVLTAGVNATPAIAVFGLQDVKTNAMPASQTTNDVEEVRDIAWTPDGRHLLVTVRLAGGYAWAPRSRLLLVDAAPDNRRQAPPTELLTLPAEIVAGSYTWAADGDWVAFLTEASSGSGSSPFLALCAVDISAGGAVAGFRYVADLGKVSDAAGVLAVPQATWSPAGDGRLVFAAPTPKVAVSNPLGLPTTSGGDPGLFVATQKGPSLTAEGGRRLGPATGLIAPAWPASNSDPSGELFALARSSQGMPLTVRGVDPISGAVRNLDVALPPTVGGTGAVVARWDLAHGRLLVLARHDNSNSGLLDYWLVQLRASAGEES
jgi:hypothetical protein